MLIKIIRRYLAEHKRLVVPQLGAFIVRPADGAVLFSEMLRRDDGVLRGLLSQRGMNTLEAVGEIECFVFEVRHTVEHGGNYPMAGFGFFTAGANNTIAFHYDPTVMAAEPAKREVKSGGEPATEPADETKSAGNEERRAQREE